VERPPLAIGIFSRHELSWAAGLVGGVPREHYALRDQHTHTDPRASAQSGLSRELIETYREPEALAPAGGIPLDSLG